MSMVDFESWYQSAHPKLVRALTAVCGDRELAADVTAEALARLWEQWDAGTVRDPAGWTYRVALNLIRRRHRRLALERRVSRHDAPPAYQPDIHPELWRALAALPRRQREAIALRYIADLTEAEVASAMGVATGTASATLATARRTLADALRITDREDSHGIA